MANPNGNPQNLRPPWQPGERVPGAGRPKKRPISEAYDDLLRSALPQRERVALGLPKGTTWAEAIALARGRQALSTRSASAVLSTKEMREGVEGKSTQRVEVDGLGEVGFEVHVVFETHAGKPPLPPADVIDVPAQVENADPALLVEQVDEEQEKTE